MTGEYKKCPTCGHRNTIWLRPIPVQALLPSTGRANSILIANGFTTVEHLMSCPANIVRASDLLNLDGFGDTSLAQVRLALDGIGVYLEDEGKWVPDHVLGGWAEVSKEKS